jgi:hypothetical protein
LPLRNPVKSICGASLFGEGELGRLACIDGSNSKADGEAISRVHAGTIGE